MPFTCCGIKYDKRDIETYWCIETDIVKPVTAKFVKDEKVYKEVCETLTCKKNGCLKVQVKRYGKFRGKKKLLQAIELHDNIRIINEQGEEEIQNPASDYLAKTIKQRTRQPQKPPLEFIPCLQTLPLVYGQAISPTRQRKKYDAALPQKHGWCNKYENGKWVPDYVEAEVHVIK